MSSGLLIHRRRRRAEINIVPLIDVMVVLIFFFLISMQFKDMNTLSLTLPEAQSAGKSEIVEQLEISITPEGDLFLNGDPVGYEELPGQIEAIARTSANVPVLIVADQESTLRFMTYVMDVCRLNGLNKIRLQTR